MHTSAQIWFDRFSVKSNGAAIEPSRLLEWETRDRFGIVVREPFGGLGAGLLISLAIAAFYEDPRQDRRAANLYPEIYLFHIGQRWGDFSPFDFWPERKELCIADDPAAVLQAINAQAITHLAVPDAIGSSGLHIYREPEAARDRIKQCYAYDPSGLADDSDVHIGSSDPEVLCNYSYTLWPERWFQPVEEQFETSPPVQANTPEAIEQARVIAHTRERWDEVSRDNPSYLKMAARIEAAQTAGLIQESYRRISVEDALIRLA